MTTTTTKTTKTPDVSATVEARAVIIRFATGQELRLDVDTLTPEIQHAAMMHGLKAKLYDAAALSRNPETGRSATVADKRAAVQAVYDRITGAGGDTPAWNATKEGGSVTGGLLAQALVRLYNGRKTPEQIRAYLAGLSDKEKTALRGDARVAAQIAAIRAEQKKPASVDTGRLLAGLGDLPDPEEDAPAPGDDEQEDDQAPY